MGGGLPPFENVHCFFLVIEGWEKHEERRRMEEIKRI